VIGALLSRTRVFVLHPLSPDDLVVLIERALNDRERGLGDLELQADAEAVAFIAEEADGDARRALSVLEASAAHAGAGGRVTVDLAREAMQIRFAGTTRPAKSTSTCSRHTINRSAAAIRRERCTGWRG
jgi:putative ATPase